MFRRRRWNRAVIVVALGWSIVPLAGSVTIAAPEQAPEPNLAFYRPDSTKLKAPDGQAGDRFSASVGVSGTTVVVGTPFAPAPPYFGFDIARDMELAAGGGGYVLEGFGGVHSMGSAPTLTPATPYFGFDVARDLELGNGSYYVLDGWGGVHNGGGAPPMVPAPPYFGFDIARDLELVPGGAYVLEGFGGVHPARGAPTLLPIAYYGLSDFIVDLELGGDGGYFVLDQRGVLHRGGMGKPLYPPLPPNFGFDIARDLEIR